MTYGQGRVEFRVLGPLEVLVAGEPQHLGGAKQRAVLAVLLLRAGEVVPVERLIDEVWGESPPPSAAHSLEAYVSRLRQLVNGHGPSLVRRGAGYALVLADSTLDAQEFELLAEQGWSAAAEGRFHESSRLAQRALALWRGPALADVALASEGRGDAERLEELRLRTFEQLFDSELALGQHDSIVGRVRALVGQNPYRERLVAQLMLALYRCGRQAEALDVYEQTRRRLDEDLGLQPSEELQQLSGQIVRQEPQLRRPRASGRREPSAPRPAAPHRARRRSSVVLAVVAGTVALSATGAAAVPAPDPVASKRIVLVHAGTADVAHVDRMSEAFRGSAKSYGYDAETLALDESVPAAVGGERLRKLIEDGRFALVLAADGTTARAVRSLVPGHPDRTFVFLDTSLRDVGLAGAPNASAIRFKDEQSSKLMGYLSTLIRPRQGERGARVDSVLVVAGPARPQVERVVRGYVSGVRYAERPIRVRVVRSSSSEDVTECERIANAGIDAGVDVVFAAAGHCGLGAIATARVRGVWSIGAEESGAALGTGVLGTTTKDWSRAIFRTIQGFHDGALLPGRDDEFGLEDDYAVLIDTSVPERVFSKVATLCSKIRHAATTGA